MVGGIIMNRQLVAFLSLFSLTLVLSVYYILIPTAKIDNTIPETEKLIFKACIGKGS